VASDMNAYVKLHRIGQYIQDVGCKAGDVLYYHEANDEQKKGATKCLTILRVFANTIYMLDTVIRKTTGTEKFPKHCSAYDLRNFVCGCYADEKKGEDIQDNIVGIRARIEMDKIWEHLYDIKSYLKHIIRTTQEKHGVDDYARVAPIMGPFDAVLDTMEYFTDDEKSP